MTELRDQIIQKIIEHDPGAKEEVDYLVRLAEKNYCSGIIEEPRLFYDSISIDQTGLESRGDPDVFFNGEQFPVRLTHLVAGIRLMEQDNGTVSDERMIQRVGLRLVFHDQDYMPERYIPAPLWATKVVAASDIVTLGTVSWRFDRPCILSARDTLRVTLQLEQDPGQGRNRRCAVVVTGVGLISKRPYFLGSEVNLTTANGFNASFPMSTADFRPDGTEPIALTDLCVSCGALDNANDPQGDIRRLRVQIRQIGNGTNANWFIGPATGLLDQCPAMLLGITTGRVVVHRFPGEGLLWEPGEGVTIIAREVEGVAIDDDVLAIGLAGYISIT